MIGRIRGYPLFFLPFVRPISDVSIGERIRRKGATTGESQLCSGAAEKEEEMVKKAAEGVQGTGMEAARAENSPR